MMRRVVGAWCLCTIAAAAILLAPEAPTLLAQDIAATSPCVNLPNPDHPKVTLRSGKMEAVIFLPDKANGVAFFGVVCDLGTNSS